MKKTKNKKGFTLMELLVVIAISSIMTGVGLISINESRKEKEVESEARKVASVVREAQNNALSGKYANQCSKWIFSLNSDANQKDFSLSCEPDAGGPIYSYSYQLGERMDFSLGQNRRIVFEVPFGIIKTTDSDLGDIVICRGSAPCKRVIVTPAGNISESS